MQPLVRGVGLYCWCALVLRWSVIVDQANVEDVTGQVSAEFLFEIYRRLAELR